MALHFREHVGLLSRQILRLTRIAREVEKIVATVERHHGAGGFNPISNPNRGWAFIFMQILGNTATTLT